MHITVSRMVGAVLAVIVAGCAYDDLTYPAPVPQTPSLQDGLWTASALPSAILRLEPRQLSESGPRSPATSLTTTSARLSTVIGIAFDARGSLWVSSQDDSVVFAFSPSALAGSGSRTPATILTPVNGSLSGPTGVAFDAQHRLWVANSVSGTLVRFDSGQLAAGGPQVPAVVLAVQGHPVGLAFDAAGTLWVSDNVGHTIAGYAADQLASSGTPRPRRVLTAANDLEHPAGLAFDAAGNLWVANSGAQTLLAFSPAQLAGAGDVAPHVVLFSSEGSLSLPVGLAFDGDGGLWVVGGAGGLTRFSKASLGVTGIPAPSSKLSIAGHALFWSVAFWPRPAGLPLR
jgi:sugar lactone lactonase YvrE